MADPWLQLWPQLWDGYIWPAAWIVIKIVVIVAPVLLSVAYLTYVERKVIGAMHLRRGPNVVGPFGLLQPIADGLKLFVKETIIPSGANRVVFIAAPCVTFIVALIAWAVIPFGDGLVLANINVGILYLFAVSSLGVYGVLMAGSLNLSDIGRAQKNLWFVVPLFPMAVIFFISTLAETNRHPFDMPEAEAELVAGYNVEYSAMTFALFFLGEYANMILMAAMTTVLFLGGWLPPMDIVPFTLIPGPVWFAFKIAAVLFIFLWVRATFPRYRYDQLMRLGWKVFLPISLAAVAVVGGAVVAFDLAPVAG